jgi:hypothetical protein
MLDELQGSQRFGLPRRIGTALKEALGGWAVNAECCYTGEGKREEDARQLDNRTSETGLRFNKQG